MQAHDEAGKRAVTSESGDLVMHKHYFRLTNVDGQFCDVGVDEHGKLVIQLATTLTHKQIKKRWNELQVLRERGRFK